jgi:hypothetical protein
MQDFTKPFKLKNEVKQLELNIPNQPKAGFIASRMNKDNFWNLLYFVGMFSGISIAFITKFMILSWITIIGFIWLVKRNADVTFDKMEQGTPIFIINGNKRVNVTGIGFIGLLIVSFGLVVGLLALIRFIVSDILKISDIPIVLTIMSMSLLVSLPALYCILRNLPIAVYFKKEAWVGDGTASYGSSSSGGFYSDRLFRKYNNWGTSSSFNKHTTAISHGSYSSSSSRSTGYSRESIITSPVHRSFSSNIYHRR